MTLNKNNKKKILYVVESLGGGVFTYIVNLSNALSDKYDIYIAYGVRKQTPKDFKNYFHPNIHLIRVKNFTRAISPKKDLKAFFELKRIESRIHPDIIHLNSSKAGVLGRWAFNGKKTPIFYTPHRYSFLMKDYSYIKRVIFKVIEKMSALRPSYTICVSKGEYEQAKAITKNVTYVNTGVDIKELNKLVTLKNINFNKTKPVVYTLGRITYPKNPKLFNELALRFPDLSFVWIGDGELRKELTADNIKISGWKSHDEALMEANKYDIFVLPSIWEGLPLSLLESMYMKKLCIVSDFVGNLGVIQNRYNGFVCDNLAEYAKAIKLYKDSKKLINNAHQDVIDKFSVYIMAKKYVKAYGLD